MPTCGAARQPRTHGAFPRLCCRLPPNDLSPRLWVSVARRTKARGTLMSQKNCPSAEEEKCAHDGRRPGKKPYQKPEFRSERVFETMALSCGKVATQFQCRRRRRSS